MNTESARQFEANEAMVKPTLIIVDDSRVMRFSLKKILQNDFELIEAVDGEDAWQKLQATPEIKGVFSDLSMPNLDGYGLLERIRGAEEERIRVLPFIVITGKEGEQDELLAEVHSKGGSDLISKPFNTDDIVQRTRQFLADMDARTAELERQAEEEDRLAAEAQAREKAAEAARLAAEQEAQQRAAEQARLAAEARAQAQAKADEEARLLAEREARRQAEEQARLAAEAQARANAEEEARLAAVAEARRQEELAARAEMEQPRPADVDAAEPMAEAGTGQTLELVEAETDRDEETVTLTEADLAKLRALQEKARRLAEERAYREELQSRLSPVSAFLLRLALPVMQAGNRLLRLNKDEQIENLRNRLYK